MLPRTTQQSYSAALGRESQIEPWLATANPLLAGAKARTAPRPQCSATGPVQQRNLAAAEGLDVRKNPPLSKEEKSFFLTSPFIEPQSFIPAVYFPAQFALVVPHPHP